MKKKIDDNNIKGYVEGFYGQLLNWESRKLIINSLSKNGMNTFFYAPKEDKNHRLSWRNEYSLKWRKNFRDFTDFSKTKNIKVIAGIAPGLDFNYNVSSRLIQNSDFNLLYNKAKQLLNDGATSIGLLLDDIPNDFKKKFGNKIPEGTSHGFLANELSEKLKQKIYFVPRVYADELIKDEPNYLFDLSLVLNQDINVFYCGQNVVSKTLTNYSKIKKILPHKIIFWDNYYSNDYCPRRFFIGPYVGRSNISNIMINPTGLINTDLLILDIVANTINKQYPLSEWSKMLRCHSVPLMFNKIKRFFLKPEFGSNPPSQPFSINDKDLEALEFLLWKWKGKLSREWYPFLFGLKHDLQLNQNKLTSERVIKTQTLPLSQYIKNNVTKGEL